MTSEPSPARPLWRVGKHSDPLGFVPWELYESSRRFDDLHARFRTLYCADMPETCLREVLADFRPNLAAMQRHVDRFGPDATDDFASMPVTAAWRRQHVLAPISVELEGPLVDLCDVAIRREVEDRFRGLLIEHDLEHLDLHEITKGRRAITQAIAADLYDRGNAGVRCPSRIDGEPCVALFEGRATTSLAGAVTPLTDPAPASLTVVSNDWKLTLEATAP